MANEEQRRKRNETILLYDTYILNGQHFITAEKVIELEVKLKKELDALEFYANEDDWSCYPYPQDTFGKAYDKGKTARAALKEINEHRPNDYRTI